MPLLELVASLMAVPAPALAVSFLSVCCLPVATAPGGMLSGRGGAHTLPSIGCASLWLGLPTIQLLSR